MVAVVWPSARKDILHTIKSRCILPTLWALSSLSSRDKLHSSLCCMQDAFSLVYKIPYRRARAWPSGLMPSARASTSILRIRNLTRRVVYKADQCAREQRYLAYKGILYIQLTRALLLSTKKIMHLGRKVKHV